MSKRQLFIGYLLVGIALNSFSQMSSNDALFENFEYRKFIQSQENSKINQKLNLQLAQSHYFLNEFKEANDYFSQVNWMEVDLDLETHLFYANSLKNVGEIEAAKAQVKTYLNYYPKDKNAILLQEQIENYGKISILKEAQIVLFNLEKINSGSAQFSPVFKDKKLYFISENKNTTYAKSALDLFSTDTDELAYGIVANPETGIYVQSNEDANWKLVKSFEKFDVGAMCWSTADNYWFLTLTPRASNWQKINKYPPRIYTWKEDSEPKKLKIQGVKGAIGVGHPTITSDGKYLIFSMDKGKQGSDLYISTKKKETKWSKPTRFSAGINTLKDEVYPVLEGDSILYFSSDGKLGFGGLDVYKVNFKNGKTEGEAVLLPQPLNTLSDDYSVLYKDNLKTQGFVVSDRKDGIGDADIYFFNARTPWKVELILHNEKGEIISNKQVNYSINGKESQLTKLSKSGFEKIELDANTKITFNFNHSDSLISEAFQTPNTNGKDTSIIVVLKEKRKVIEVISDIKTTENESFEIDGNIFVNPIYFEFDKFNITKTSEQNILELARILKENPERKVIVKTLSDERGDIFYNLDLSSKRAKEVYKLLLKKGVSPQQIRLQSLGEAIYDEKCSPNCDESIHSKYRRADFEIR